jgi:hypothetical protein
MFRNLATLILYIGILFFNVQLPPILIILYTTSIILGDGFEYFPKNIQKMIYPLWFFFEIMGPIGYNIEFGTIILLSLYILGCTLYKFYF